MVLRELINLIGYEIDEAAYKEVEGRTKELFEKIDKFGKEMSVKVTAPLTGMALLAVKEFTDYATALAIVNQRIQGTGGAAGKTADELDKMSVSLQTNALNSHDEILKKTMGTLLIFDKIQGDTFDRATQSSIDLAAAFELDLASGALMVGKALNTPAEGLDALSRKGIRFTKVEKTMIENMVNSGRTADAQRYILDRLDRAVGGTAKAIRDSGSGFKGFQLMMKDMGEEFGKILLPYFRKFYAILTKIAEKFRDLSPATKKTILIFAALAAAIGPIAVALGGIGGIAFAAQKAISILTTGVSALAGALGVTSAAALGWVALIVAALALLFFIVDDIMTYMEGGNSLIGRFIAPWTELGPKIMANLQPIIDWLKITFEGFIQLWRGISQLVIGIFSGDADMILKGVQNLVIGILKEIWGLWGALTQLSIFLGKVIFKVLIEIGERIFDWFATMLKSLVDLLMRTPVLGSVLRGIGTVGNAISNFGQMGSGGGGTLTDATGFEARARAQWARPSSDTKNVNVNSTIAMTVPAGTQAQQVTAVKAAAEQAVQFSFENHLRSTFLQVQQ